MVCFYRVMIAYCLVDPKGETFVVRRDSPKSKIHVNIGNNINISLSIVNSSSTPRKSSSSSQRDKIDFTSLLALFKQAHSDYIKRTADTHESIVDAVALDLNAYMKNPSNLSTP